MLSITIEELDHYVFTIRWNFFTRSIREEYLSSTGAVKQEKNLINTWGGRMSLSNL